MMTQEMINRTRYASVEWKELEGGYFVGKGYGPLSPLLYIALPENHPCVGHHYDEYQDLEVNGGLTFGKENVFGWDYGHFENDHDYVGDLGRALAYFITKENGKLTEQRTVGRLESGDNSPSW